MIRRFFLTILVLALIGICAYNSWQLRRMQEQIDHMQRQIAAEHKPHTSTAKLDLPDNSQTGWLDLANTHLDRAHVAAEKADFGTARRELALSMKDMKEAAAEPKVKTEAGLKDANKRMRALQAQADSLLQKLHLGQ